jgi:hypothetical protein
MRITKNNVGIEIELEEFLDVLESGLFDDMLLFIVALDTTSPEDFERMINDERGLDDVQDDDMVEEFHVGYVFEGPMAGHEMNNYINLIEQAIEKAHEAMMHDFDGEYEELEIDTSAPVNFKRPKSSYSHTNEDIKVRTLLSKYKGL